MEVIGNIPTNTSSQQEGVETSSEELSYEKVFLKAINSPSFSEYLAPTWNDGTEESTWMSVNVKNTEEDKVTGMESVEEEDSGYLIFDDKSQSFINITDIVSSELEAYVNLFITAFVGSFREYVESTGAVLTPSLDLELITSTLQGLISEAIRKDASKNSQYCKKVIKWLASKRNSSHYSDEDAPSALKSIEQEQKQQLSSQISSVSDVCDEYMKFAPGPWRECTLIEAVKGACACACAGHV